MSGGANGGMAMDNTPTGGGFIQSGGSNAPQTDATKSQNLFSIFQMNGGGRGIGQPEPTQPNMMPQQVQQNLQPMQMYQNYKAGGQQNFMQQGQAPQWASNPYQQRAPWSPMGRTGGAK